MKEVIVLRPSAIERVPVELCSPKNLYYGARRPTTPSWRGIIVRDRYHTTIDKPANFQLRCFDEFTRGNIWNIQESPNFEIFLRNVINEGWEVMQFETMKELAEWLNV